MALLMQNLRLSNGRTAASAYVKATVTGSTRAQCSLLLEVWSDAVDRDSGSDPLDRQTVGIQNPPDVSAPNPVAYAYALLKTQPVFSGATDA